MSAGWQTFTLGQLGRVVTGKTPKTSDPNNFGGQIPFVTPTDMDGGKAMTTTARYLSESGASTIKSSIIPAGSVMVSCIGSDMGKSVIAKHRCVTNQQINSVVIDAQFSSEFVYYNLSARKAELQHLASGGSTMPILNKSMFSEVTIDLPPLAEQLQIAETLSALDDRITLLRETNATLEAIAQALFKSWFVDFDPVRAKMEGRAPEGMDEATAALFPDALEESELGWVPKGWRVGTLADVATLNAQSLLARNPPPEINYIDLAGVKANVFDVPQCYSFADAPSRARRVLHEGDCIVGTVRPGNRSFGFIATAQNHLTGSTGFAVLSPKQCWMTAFTYLCATRDESIDRLAALADGGAYPAVRPEVVASTPCALPTDEVMKAFDSISRQLLKAIGGNSEQAQTLATLRDTLLPRLISGQLRLPEAQALVAAA